ncbi:MAG: hypothetical protein IH591_18170, partial [Bacteroidales bacterium]|nr:hypothetical protein [Bacteroidales bacterium]
EYRFVNIGGQGYFEEGLIHFFKDRYYVKVVTNSRSKSIMKSLEIIARSVAASLPGADAMPALILRLPSEGRQANQELYINESVLGHSFLKGAVKAAYTLEGNSFTLYYFENETTAQAAEAVAAWLKLYGIEPLDDNMGKFQFRDGYNGEVYLIWNQSTFAVITGLGSGMEDFVGAFISKIATLK